MSKRLNMSNDEAVEWLLSLKNLDICGENRKTAIDKAIKALEAQPCIEDYPTCTECEHYDSEKHYCPRFCQVIKDTLAEAQPSEDTEVIKVSKGAVKTRQGRFVIYDVDWLKENFYTTEEKIYGQPKQPCEDAVSRTLVHEAITASIAESENPYEMWQRIEALPSVTPQTVTEFADKCKECGKMLNDKLQPCEDCINREAVRKLICQNNDYYGYSDRFHEFTEKCLQLPLVTPQRTKGKWIYEMQVMNNPYTYKCSVCKGWEKDKTKYCPNCGSYNGGEEE